VDYKAILTELPNKVDRSLFKVERWATPEEGHALYTLIQAHRIRTYIECGTANGYSALWAAAAMGGGNIRTWDIVDRPKIWMHTPELADLSMYIHCETRPFAQGLAETLPSGPRLWFIDGEHRYSDAWHDWRVVRLFADEGDVVVFHDVLCCTGVATAYAELVRSFRGGIIHTARGMGVIFPEQFVAESRTEGRAGEVVGDLQTVPIQDLGETDTGCPEAP
jgi:predicted O-methyltransferase YrrM